MKQLRNLQAGSFRTVWESQNIAGPRTGAEEDIWDCWRTMTHRGASRLVLFLSKCYCRHQIKQDEIGGTNAHTVCTGKVKGNRPLARPGRWWQNVKLEIKETGFDELDWINVAQNMNKWQGVLNMIMNLRVPQNAGTVFTSSWTRSVWRRPAWRHQNIWTLRYTHIYWMVHIKLSRLDDSA
jgi:hypothetical protein